MTKNVLTASNKINKDILCINKKDDLQKNEFFQAENMNYSEIVKLNHDIMKINYEINKKKEVLQSKVNNKNNLDNYHKLKSSLVFILLFVHLLFYLIFCCFYYTMHSLEDFKAIKIDNIRKIIIKMFFSSLFVSFMCEIYILIMNPIFSKIIRIYNMLILFYIFTEFYITFLFEYTVKKILRIQ